jgi:hypothetical protein
MRAQEALELFGFWKNWSPIRLSRPGRLICPPKEKARIERLIDEISGQAD